MFKSEDGERWVRAGVLAALSAVPISIGVTVSDPTVRTACFMVGGLLWLWAVALVLPGGGRS